MMFYVPFRAANAIVSIREETFGKNASSAERRRESVSVGAREAWEACPGEEDEGNNVPAGACVGGGGTRRWEVAGGGDEAITGCGVG